MQLISDSEIDFSQYLRETDAKVKVKPASHWIGELVDELRNPDRTKKVHLPWEKSKDDFLFRPGEVTLWAGQNGHGKTQIVSQVVLSLMGQNEKACIASFEMKPKTTMKRLARMYARENPYHPAFQQGDGIESFERLYREFGEWSDSRLWLYDQTGTVGKERVIGMARYCAKELNIGHVVIDSLMKCVRGEDDYNEQKEFVDELTALARDNQTHIHIVHHLKKPPNESHVPDKHDSKGSGAITDLVDNVMMVWRNKPKEDDLKKGGLCLKKTEHDAALLCRKQRNGEAEPTITLWFDKDSQQFKGGPDDELHFFPNWPHRETRG